MRVDAAWCNEVLLAAPKGNTHHVCLCVCVCMSMCVCVCVCVCVSGISSLVKFNDQLSQVKASLFSFFPSTHSCALMLSISPFFLSHSLSGQLFSPSAVSLSVSLSPDSLSCLVMLPVCFLPSTGAPSDRQ